jgi:hypothetical protein
MCRKISEKFRVDMAATRLNKAKADWSSLSTLDIHQSVMYRAEGTIYSGRLDL